MPLLTIIVSEDAIMHVNEGPVAQVSAPVASADEVQASMVVMVAMMRRALRDDPSLAPTDLIHWVASGMSD